MFCIAGGEEKVGALAFPPISNKVARLNEVQLHINYYGWSLSEEAGEGFFSFVVRTELPSKTKLNTQRKKAPNKVEVLKYRVVFC